MRHVLVYTMIIININRAMITRMNSINIMVKGDIVVACDDIITNTLMCGVLLLNILRLLIILPLVYFVHLMAPK